MDLRKLKTLIDLVQNSGISELEISEGEEKIRIAKHFAAAPATTTVNMPVATTAAAPTAVAPAPTIVVESIPAPAEGHVMKAPMVGTFYRAASPESKPFVEGGARVIENSVVCIIEAMKIMNEIQAETKGAVIEVLVENGQPVEYGQRLFKIKQG